MKILNHIYTFYLDGFRSMTVGKTLWKIIFIKLLIILFVVKYLFYGDPMGKKLMTTERRAEYVRQELLKPR